MLPMKISEPLPGVLHYLFACRKDMTLSMCRIQEFYESPFDHIRGKYFSWPDFIETYSDGKGNIDYWSYWDGFNAPLHILNDFFKKFPEKTLQEMDIVCPMLIKSAKYMIATAEDSHPSTLPHEMAHALFATDDVYREQTRKFMAGFSQDTTDKLCASLLKLKYPNEMSILGDEVQAYLLTSELMELNATFLEFRPEELYTLQNNFRGHMTPEHMNKIYATAPMG
jgi:hypothetical protein